MHDQVEVIPPGFDLAAFRRRLVGWYGRQGRDLPWRRTRDPYRIWVSEIMLQQTQVSTVIPYYERFLKTFPSLRALARAPIRKVLKCWEGLGYYARARNLHRAAKTVVGAGNGKIPTDVDRLSELPGVGRSTAGAIVSLAFGMRGPILDGNVRRVLCRVFAIEDDARRPETTDRLWKLSEACLPITGPDRFNQAMMDLGATLCTPRHPSCLLCPVRSICLGYEKGIVDRIPLKAARSRIPQYDVTVAVITRAGRYGDELLMAPRPNRGLLGGLWGMPEFGPNDGPLVTQIKSAIGIVTAGVRRLKPVPHVYSHKRVTYRPLYLRYVSGRPAPGWRWISMSDRSRYPVSVATKKILDSIRGVTEESLPLAAESESPYRTAETELTV
jgi:A/G-specific adenine glycosylase